MILIWTFLLYFIDFYLTEIFRRIWQKVPPGPWPLPLIGNLHQLALAHSRSDLALAKLAKKYGEIYRLKVGLSDAVVLSSHEAFQHVLTNKDSMGRDLRGTFQDRNNGKNAGIVFSDGPKWETIRPWTIRNLKEFGFHKTLSMESSILENIEFMFKKTEESLSSDGTAILDAGEWIALPLFKFIWKLLVGQFTPEDESISNRLIKKSQAMVRSGIMGVGLANAFPVLRFVFPNLTGHNIMMDFYSEAYRTAEHLLRKAQSRKIETPKSFIEAYVKKMSEVGDNDPHDCFNAHDFAVLFMDLVQGGSDTTTSYLESLILHMINYPDVQSKVYQEICNTIPKGQPLSLTHLQSMIYTQAVMLEVHRHTKVLQHFVPRKALNDIRYKDYIIPKGTTILPDVHTIYNCGEIWENPEAFQPERFINKAGEIINKQYVIPFGIGKRNCPAANFGESSTFLFFVSILQKFQLSNVSGEPLPRIDMSVGFTSRPFPFKVAITKRK